MAKCVLATHTIPVPKSHCLCAVRWLEGHCSSAAQCHEPQAATLGHGILLKNFPIPSSSCFTTSKKFLRPVSLLLRFFLPWAENFPLRPICDDAITITATPPARERQSCYLVLLLSLLVPAIVDFRILLAVVYCHCPVLYGFDGSFQALGHLFACSATNRCQQPVLNVINT